MIDEDAGRIVSLFSKRGNLLSGTQPPILTARFRNGEGKAFYFDTASAGKVTSECDNNRCELRFSDFEGIDLTVTVTAEGSKESPLIKWHAGVECGLQLEWLEFPGVNIENTFKENGGNSKLLWPYNEGVLVDSIADRMQHFCYQEPEYPSQGSYGMCPGMVSTPFMALLSDKGGLYIGAHDTAQNTFMADFCPSGDDVSLKLRVWPGIYGGSYKTEYDTVLGVFEGDWHNAADIYRDWFEQNRSERFIPIEQNPALPEWYGDSPVVLTYCVRGHHDTDVMEPNALFPYINGMKAVDEIAKKTDSRIMVILMHWEGTAPWAPPYVWPPYGGEDKLKEYIDALHSKGHVLGVYCSGLGWTQASNLVDYRMDGVLKARGYDKYMCKSPEQELPVSKICNDQRTGYDMCPSQDFCKDIITGEVEKMAASGIDYIQLLDQNHGGTPYFCYANDHGHPPVPGTWESTEARDMLKRAKAASKNDKLLLGCESAAAEAFIPELLFSDNRFELDFMFGLPVPLYSYLYHTYLNNFMGNQVCGEGVMANAKTEYNLLYRIAHSFVAGDMLTLVINDEGRLQWAWGQRNFDESYMPDTDKHLEFVKNINKWRRGKYAKYLHSGKMVHPLPLEGLELIDLETNSGTKKVSPLLSSRYEASDGTKGQIIVNYTDSPVKVTVKGAEGMQLLSDIDSEGEVLKGEELTVSALSAVMITEK